MAHSGPSNPDSGEVRVREISLGDSGYFDSTLRNHPLTRTGHSFEPEQQRQSVDGNVILSGEFNTL